MAKEDFKFERSPFAGVFRVFAMDFFIDSAYSVSISYFEFGKILVLFIQAVIEVSNGLSLFTLFYLSN